MSRHYSYYTHIGILVCLDPTPPYKEITSGRCPFNHEEPECKDIAFAEGKDFKTETDSWSSPTGCYNLNGIMYYNRADHSRSSCTPNVNGHTLSCLCKPSKLHLFI